MAYPGAARIAADLARMADCTATPGEGITRLPFTPAARQTVDRLAAIMRSAGLAVREDAAGNLIGRWEGTNPGAPAILIGSHYDSVPHGGNFDGMAGILVGIEVARQLRAAGLRLSHPLEIIGTVDEEGVRFGRGYFGTDAMLGNLTLPWLQTRRDAQGVSIAEAMAGYGLDPARIGEARRAPGSIAAWLEVHVEQGRVLESAGERLGLVEGIVGIRQLEVELEGMADHAGATPMDLRADAVEAACKIIAGIGDDARRAGGGTVATVGRIETYPGANNVIAERCRFTVDIRSLDQPAIEWVAAELERRAVSVCEALGTRYRLTVVSDHPQGWMDRGLQARLADACTRLGMGCRRMPSGAGHDALVMALAGLPTAMLFVPSRAGRSHAPVEWSDADDLAGAAAVLVALLTDGRWDG